MATKLDARQADFEAAFTQLLAAQRGTLDNVEDQVREIIAAVAAEGDAALQRYTERFDRLALTADRLRVSEAEIEQASALVSTEARQALDLAVARITDHHRRQKPDDLCYEDGAGLTLGYRWTPITAAGLYVPGGRAAYPSSVLMNALPAKVAGVERLVMVVPAPEGHLNPLVLAAARLAGVDEVYRVGGAQAVAALAYGTESILPVDKIVGPGNAYVAAAKRQVFGRVGIDLIAGPSEVLIVADGDNDPGWIAADLLAQCEHDPAAQAILITDDVSFAAAVERAVDRQVAALPRSSIAAASWRDHGAVILVDRLEDAATLVDRIAPEHLELAVEDPDSLLALIRNAGAIFLGRRSPEALGDYLAGPNHVLPTSGSARFSSGLSVLDFMKRSSLMSCSPAGLRAIGPAAITLARAEGLEAHAQSIVLRLDELNR